MIITKDDMQHIIRKPTRSELPALAQLWYDGWQAAHAAHVPASLTAIRTLESFAIRLSDNFEDIRVLGEIGDPFGLCIVKGAEIYQIFVSPKAQGTGAAAALITDGLERIRAAGHTTAKLDVVPENTRAIAFYEKMGWRKKGVETILLDTLTDPFPMPCLVMTKEL
jgi:ribosomal protein S18 acetylase RimI-like enzyme